MKKTMFKRLLSMALAVLLVITAMASVMADKATASEGTEEHQLGLKVLHEKIPGLTMAPKIYTASASLPASVDLSNKLPAPGNQGSLGSCVAWATGYAYKSHQEGKERGWDFNTKDEVFSPAYIYNQIHLSNSADGGGSYFSAAFDLLKSQGCTTWSDMPYSGTQYNYTQQPSSQQRANAAKYKAKAWNYLSSGDYNEVRAHLATGDAVVIGIPVYPDFENISSSNPIFDNTNGDLRGYHAICIVGYDDSKQAVKIINSWSSNWGINGYGWMSYNLISSLNSELYVMTDIIDNPTPTPTPGPTVTPTPTPGPTPDGSNVALKKTVDASDAIENQPVSYANDGNASTFWAAPSQSDQWISVDLGSSYAVKSMRIKWSQNNYPKTYYVQALNGSSWKNVKTVTGSAGINNITFSSPVNAQKFRVYCTQPNSAYFTIYEWEAYASSPVPPSPTPNPNPDYTDVALKKEARSSGAIKDHLPALAVDGDSSSYWAAPSSKDQWIYVYLKSRYSVNSMDIKWSTSNYPRTYQIQSWDGKAWQNVQTVYGKGGSNKITFTKPINTNYFRLLCTKPNSTYFTIYDWKVYGK